MMVTMNKTKLSPERGQRDVVRLPWTYKSKSNLLSLVQLGKEIQELLGVGRTPEAVTFRHVGVTRGSSEVRLIQEGGSDMMMGCEHAPRGLQVEG